MYTDNLRVINSINDGSKVNKLIVGFVSFSSYNATSFSVEKKFNVVVVEIHMYI